MDVDLHEDETVIPRQALLDPTVNVDHAGMQVGVELTLLHTPCLMAPTWWAPCSVQAQSSTDPYAAPKDAMSVPGPRVSAAGHDSRPLPSLDTATVEQYLERCEVKGKLAYKCRYPECTTEFFRRKHMIGVHLHKHFRSPRFECVAW